MPADWARAKKILCVRLDSLGDVLMTTPALRALKNSSATRRLVLLTSSAGAAVVPYIPEIDTAILYDAPWLKATAPRTSSQPDFEMIERLRQEKFDAAIIFTVYTQNPLPSALLCMLADIPLRLAHCRENPYQLLTDWVKDTDEIPNVRHEVQRQLDLVQAIGCKANDVTLSFQISKETKTEMANLLKKFAIKKEWRWLLVHPGASAPSRRYQPEGFADFAQMMMHAGYEIVFTGGADEVELVESIRARIHGRTHSVAGRLGLEQLAALISLAPVFVTNNTGPAHVAAAVGTPVVDLYALTNPQHTPWAVPHKLLYHDVTCRFCFKSICPLGHNDCLRKIEPSQIVEAALSLAQRPPAAAESLR